MYLTKTSGNLNPRGQQPQSVLQVSTVRSFEGGLNVTDTDLNLSPKFARVLDNFERGTDGALSIRPGTVFLANLEFTGDSTQIVNHTYFAGLIWSVQFGGTITTTDGAGTVTFKGINNTTSLAWPGDIQYVSFTIFNSDLIITNGRDKPLIVAGRTSDPNYLIVQFLVDKATVSNVNTPIGKYVIAHGRYTVFAGVASDPSTLFISQQDTSGTYPGDPIPNDAIALDVGPRVSLGDSTITGMVAYRDKLLVTFERGVLPINLGVYTGTPAVHTPTDDGFIEEYGCLAHRSLVSVGDDTFFNDNVGINSVQRISLFNTLRPARLSQLIDPLITPLVQRLTAAQIQQYVFAVYDLQHFRYMLFIPTFDSFGILTETICFSYTNIPTLKVSAWARLRGWKWQSACRTALQNIVFSRDRFLYVYDFSDNTVNADRLNNPLVNEGAGEAINATWELPWADFKHRMDLKILKYIQFDTQGNSPFRLRAYVDNIRQTALADGADLDVMFTGGDVDGSGTVTPGTNPFGAANSTRDERLMTFNTKYKLLKLVINVSSKLKLKIISISIAYLHGSIRR